MGDWIDSIGDALFHFAHYLSENRTPKQTIGIFSAALACIFVVGAIIAVAIGTKVEPVGWYFLISFVTLLIAVTGYCFATP